MATIHLPQSTDLAELRRVMELIQKPGPSVAAVKTDKATGNTGASSSGGGASVGTVSPQGPAGPAGVADLTGVVVARTEIIEPISTLTGDLISDSMGYLVTSNHVSWDIVTDNAGNIVTKE